MDHIWAYTGHPPKPNAYVGYVNLSKAREGIAVTVRSEGEGPPSAQYVVPDAELRSLYNALGRYLQGKEDGQRLAQP